MNLEPLPTIWRMVVEYCTWQPIWRASLTLRIIYWLRLLLMAIPIVAALMLIEAARSWPREKFHLREGEETGEEHLVLQREFKAAQDRDREVQQELKEVVKELQARQAKFEIFQQRIEEKFELGAKVMWAVCSVLIGQLVSHLLNLRLRREMSKYGRRRRDEIREEIADDQS